MAPSRVITVVQHVECETLGTIEQSLFANGLSPHHIRVHLGDDIRVSIGNAAGLIVMGGPMSVYESDARPHLLHEMRLIESALSARLPVLGVCLGCQLLAHVLGARVYPGARKGNRMASGETGTTMPDPIRSGRACLRRSPAFHWHGDVFDQPQDSVNLASSDLTSCQSFRFADSAYGILFHMEVTDSIIASIAATFPNDLTEGGCDPHRLAEESRQHASQLAALGRQVFDGWARLAVGDR